MLNLVISQSKSFEAGNQNGSTNFVAEGDIISTLEALDFEPHVYFDRQTGRKVSTRQFWHKVDADEQNGTFVFIGKVYWWAINLVNGEYVHA